MKPTEAMGRMVRRWRGHVVEVSPRGLVIDGRTVDPAPLTERDAVRPSDDPRTHPSLQFLAHGVLVYRGRVQAELHPGSEPTVHGPGGAKWTPEPQRHPGRKGPAAGPAPPRVDDDLDIGL
ncbi:hypothetical protein ACFQ7A_04735 [Streptomyces sp. NPDC056528]|uniref:hypothetical protein n=1 Tax=Streptomyces sp. NPDC056528 TaxID=3345854 RepID=UPI00369CF2CF